MCKVDENNQYFGAPDGNMPFIRFVDRKNLSMKLVKTLLKKSAEETDPHKMVMLYLPLYR